MSVGKEFPKFWDGWRKNTSHIIRHKIRNSNAPQEIPHGVIYDQPRVNREFIVIE
jgi:hypothetical protein